MKKISSILAVIWAIQLAGCSDKDTVLVRVYPYMKDGYSNDIYTEYDYSFEGDLLSCISINEINGIGKSITEITIKRVGQRVSIIKNGSEDIGYVDILSDGEASASVYAYDGVFLISYSDSAIWGGIHKDKKDRPIQAELKNGQWIFKFRLNGEPINSYPYIDFTTALKLDEVVILNEDGQLRRIEKNIYEDNSLDDIPVKKYQILKNSNTVKIQPLDIMIDYLFCTTFEHPFILSLMAGAK